MKMYAYQMYEVRSQLEAILEDPELQTDEWIDEYWCLQELVQQTVWLEAQFEEKIIDS